MLDETKYHSIIKGDLKTPTFAFANTEIADGTEYKLLSITASCFEIKKTTALAFPSECAAVREDGSLIIPEILELTRLINATSFKFNTEEIPDKAFVLFSAAYINLYEKKTKVRYVSSIVRVLPEEKN